MMDHVIARVRASTVAVVSARGRGHGAGVLWTEQLVVTNAHVAQAATLEITLFDGRRHRGRVVGADPDRDLAVVQLDAAVELSGDQVDRSAPIARGRTAPLRAGELVIAVGHPLGFRAAASAGVIHVPCLIDQSGRSWVVADLRLAPGNSGGPLADADGALLGLNTLVVSGLAFAIPAADIEQFVAAVGAAGMDVLIGAATLAAAGVGHRGALL